MTNRLIHEASPYLRQHAENPVDWYAWGQEALTRARQQNKPVHLSVGYAACHWCHVMAHESFEDPDTARFLNEHFVNIKVDRQERPDLDHIYQKVVQLMGQGGGWPLTVFLTPEGEPFFGGTYFPPRDGYGRPSFLRVLRGLSDAWRDQREKLLGNVSQLREGYLAAEQRLLSGGVPPIGDFPAEAAKLFAMQTDPIHGGLGGAPKFPNPSCYDLVLRVYHRTRAPALLRSIEVTLDGMAAGGIYDQLGGGFARYSVDERWEVPHFEKMLYDNAQLVKIYADAYRVTGKDSWRRVFEETIDYVLRELSHTGGCFYSSEDADSEGAEGRFYVWTPSQVKDALGEEDGQFACRAYGITSNGNFDHATTVLHRATTLEAPEFERLKGLRERLFHVRASRTRPGRDENILTSWNGLMIQGLCAAYQATGTESYMVAAQRAADFIQGHLTTPSGAGLFRTFKDGTPKVPGFLDDYAFLANALLDLYESCFEKRYLDWAIGLVDTILGRFWDNGPLFVPKDGEPLILRPRAPQDDAWPSGASTSVFALLRLYELTTTELYRERAAQVLAMYAGAASENPFGFSHLLSAMDFAHRDVLGIVFAGDKEGIGTLAQVVHRNYHPARVLAFADDVPIGKGRHAVDEMPAAYVCRRRTCSTPVTSATALIDSCEPRAPLPRSVRENPWGQLNL